MLQFDHEGFTHTFKVLSLGLFSSNLEVAKGACQTLRHLIMGCKPNLPGFDYKGLLTLEQLLSVTQRHPAMTV